MRLRRGATTVVCCKSVRSPCSVVVFRDGVLRRSADFAERIDGIGIPNPAGKVTVFSSSRKTRTSGSQLLRNEVGSANQD